MKNIKMQSNKIEVSDLSFCYKKQVKILDNINFCIKENSVNVILGKNGCGKSTLLKILANQLADFSGNIKIADRDISAFSQKEYAKKVAYLNQINSTHNITVKMLVEHGRYPHLSLGRAMSQRDNQIVKDAINALELQNFINTPLVNLSGGQRQKAYIAMILAQEADIILLDEPITFLDISHQLEVLDIIKNLKYKNRTVIVVLHDINLALKIADNIIILDSGKIAYQDENDYKKILPILNQVFNVNLKAIEDTNGKVNIFIS